MSGLVPKPKAPQAPPPPPSAPTAADASVIEAGRTAARPGSYSSMVSTSSQGLTRKANTAKTTLIGGA